MVDWDQKDPAAWARQSGMVLVPMFGRARMDAPPGRHCVLLDGYRASLALSIGNAEEICTRYEPQSWSWSSNLLKSLILDEISGDLILRRWDRPGQDRIVQVPDAVGLNGFIRDLAKDSVPSAKTVIEKMIGVFRQSQGLIEIIQCPVGLG
jgi:hypothetical protein